MVSVSIPSHSELSLSSTHTISKEVSMLQRAIPQILTQIGFNGELKPVRTLTSAVTTAWGVNWDEVYIARDLLQNFFDANRDQLQQIIVQEHGADVVISAPASFQLKPFRKDPAR